MPVVLPKLIVSVEIPLFAVGVGLWSFPLYVKVGLSQVIAMLFLAILHLNVLLVLVPSFHT